MSASSFESLVNYTGDRYRNNQGIQDLCVQIDDLSCRDLLNVVTAVSKVRADGLTPRDVIKGSHFHTASSLDQRDLHHVDSILFDAFSSVPFVELSPVQPFGLNTAIAGLGEDNILASLRRSEVNADISTALFRECMLRNSELRQPHVRLASNARITRAQSFDPETKFLPHFKMFGQVTVGREGTVFEETVAGHLLTHLLSEARFLEAFRDVPDTTMTKVTMTLGDVRLLQILDVNGKIDAASTRKHTADPQYSLFDVFGIDAPSRLPLDSDDLTVVLDELGAHSITDDLKLFREKIHEQHPDLVSSTEFNLGRIAGGGYYKGLCYSMSATSEDGLTLPLVDGGYTDWAKKYTNNKRALSVSSGIGTELLAKYFLHHPGA